MKNQTFYQLFVDELENMFSSENQILEVLPALIKVSSQPELKEALSDHFKETENQVTRIQKIFSILNITPTEKICEGMKGILQEGKELLENKEKSPTLDAAIISATQKVEHYEMASYGTLRSFANYLDLDSEIYDLIQDSLAEEGAIDKKLTKIADGSFFSSGVNKEAAAFVSQEQYRKVG